jgi:hypothetical protein
MPLRSIHHCKVIQEPRILWSNRHSSLQCGWPILILPIHVVGPPQRIQHLSHLGCRFGSLRTASLAGSGVTKSSCPFSDSRFPNVTCGRAEFGIRLAAVRNSLSVRPLDREKTSVFRTRRHALQAFLVRRSRFPGGPSHFRPQPLAPAHNSRVPSLWVRFFPYR